MRDLDLVVARRDLRGRERVGAVAVGVLQPRTHAVRRPVAWAAELGLEAAGGGDDRAEHVVGDPVRAVVVVEGDRPARVRERDVGPAGCAAGAVVLVPGPVDRGLERVAAGRQVVTGSFQIVVLGVTRQLRLVAPRGPVLGRAGRGHAAELAVVAAGGRDRSGCSTGPPPPPPPPVGRRRHTGHCRRRGDRRGLRRGRRTIARYSTGVPAGEAA